MPAGREVLDWVGREAARLTGSLAPRVERTASGEVSLTFDVYPADDEEGDEILPADTDLMAHCTLWTGEEDSPTKLAFVASLLLVQLVIQAEERYGIVIEDQAIESVRTCRDLADLIFAQLEACP